jgi:pyruvate/2-oxoglutarate dehydrogenase complex dihydrolipoamide dehydrogenase (E3) component
MYIKKHKKPKRYDFDLLVIGSGAGGGTAAHLAASEGKKVGLVEAHGLGGESLSGSCLPTKALFKSAQLLDTLHQAHQFGIKASDATFNFRNVMAWVDKAVAATGVNNEATAFKSEGIFTIRGHAHFVSPWVVNVGQRHISAKNYIIATGSSLSVPIIPGLSEAGYITYHQIRSLTKLPQSLFIIGGGAVAYEYAQIFSSFGVKVHVCEVLDHMLPGQDPEISDSAEAALNAKGVRTHAKAQITEISGNRTRKVVVFEQNGQQHRVAVEQIMVATGKIPNLDLGLENTGLHCSKTGIAVNRYMQTNIKHIFAVGDVAGQYKSYQSHLAIQEARVAVHNLYHRKKIAMDYQAVPKCLCGTPEIAVVGKTERELVISGQPYQTAIAPLGIIGSAITNNYKSGFVKIVATHTGILLGASIVAPEACEMIAELTLAIRQRQHACEISKTIHGFATWSEAVRVACDRIKCA